MITPKKGEPWRRIVYGKTLHCCKHLNFWNDSHNKTDCIKGYYEMLQDQVDRQVKENIIQMKLQLEAQTAHTVGTKVHSLHGI